MCATDEGDVVWQHVLQGHTFTMLCVVCHASKKHQQANMAAHTTQHTLMLQTLNAQLCTTVMIV